MAAYRFTEDEEETNNMFQWVRCKALAVLHNYFVFKTNADRKKYVDINNVAELLSYLTNKDAYTLEHFIIPKEKRYIYRQLKLTSSIRSRENLENIVISFLTIFSFQRISTGISDSFRLRQSKETRRTSR